MCVILEHQKPERYNPYKHVLADLPTKYKAHMLDIFILKYNFFCSSNMLKEKCISVIRQHLPTIRSEYGVTGLTLFGSVAR